MVKKTSARKPDFLQKISKKTPVLKNVKTRSLIAALCAGTVGAGTVFAVIAILRKAGQFDYSAATIIGLFMGVLLSVFVSFLVTYPRSTLQFIVKQKYVFLTVACLLLFFFSGVSALLGSWHFDKYKGTSITYDEVSILPNGFFYRDTGTYYLNPEHPPLVKYIATIPFEALKAGRPQEKFSKELLLQDYAQYYWGKVFLFESKNQTEALIFWARFSVLLTNTILLLIAFASLAKLWNKRAAFIGVFLLAVSPFSIAHASLVTVDFMAAILSLLSMIWFAMLLQRYKEKKPFKLTLLLTAIFLYGALVAKFSTVLLIPITLLFFIVYGLCARKQLQGRWLRYSGMFFILAILTFFLLCLFYGWFVRNMSSSDIVEQLRYNFSSDYLPEWVKTPLETIAGWGQSGRGFVEYCIGVIKVNTRIAKGAGGVVFLGDYYGSEGAGVGYFPVVYLAKLHIGFHVAGIAALVAACFVLTKSKLSNFWDWIADRPAIPLLSLYCFVFAAIAMTSTLQLGIRHIMPVVFGLAVMFGYGIDKLLSKMWKYQKHIATGLSVIGMWMVTTVLLAHPYYLSYYNGFAGGTGAGYKVATDSNYDWGQDLKQLSKWMKDNNVKDMYVDVFANPLLPLHYYLGHDAKIYHIAKDKSLPSGTILAVSANQYEINNGTKKLPDDKRYSQYDNYQIDRVGKTIFIYRIP